MGVGSVPISVCIQPECAEFCSEDGLKLVFHGLNLSWDEHAKTGIVDK